MAIVAGIDGCRSGWLCLIEDLSTQAVQAHLLTHVRDLLALTPRPDVVMIDIPIGLADSGSRACDQEARARLKAPRASSVFPAPIRPMLAANDYAQACQIGLSVDGRKLSRQTWGILPKIREVDAFLRSNPSPKPWLREVHPEVSFWAWNGGQAMTHSKKSPEGQQERSSRVTSRYGSALAAVRRSLPRGRSGLDDLLDAFAALWSGERVVAGTALVLPAVPGVDACGLRMEIVA